MTRIAPVRLPYNPKTLWFDAGDLQLEKDQPVVVLTARGTEFGHLADEVFEAEHDQIKKLKTPLKPVKRAATEQDIARAEEMERLSAEALPVFKEMAAETSGDMHPVSVEYLLDGDKAVFYFEAEERVDFRDLVRRLASRFHVRIDMRQIGVRDEARMVGGLGHCGQELCCKRLGGEFCPVSIRMAKEQDLSLNPQKISGVCGRLMCCLRYEFDAYKDFKGRSPKQNATIKVPGGTAKVSNLDVPREVVTLRLEDGKTVKVPLADFDPPEGDATRPSSIGEDAWERATSDSALGMATEGTFLTSQFTGSDKLGDAKARRGGTGGKGSGGKRQGGSGNVPAEPARKRRRRSTKVGGEAEGERPDKHGKKKPAGQGGQGQQKKRSGQNNKRQGQQGTGPAGSSKKQGTGPRPGQKSSGLRQQQGGGTQRAGQGGKPRPEGAQGEGRRKRRRSHKAGGQGKGGEANEA